MTEDAKALSLNFIATGPEDAATVVFIHAVGYELSYWDRQIEALLGEYRVVAFDLPGHGRSPIDLAHWSFDGVAAAVARLIETIADGPVHLVGLSFGGMVAQAAALARPDLLRSLTLIGSAATFPEAAREAMLARAQLTRDAGMAAVLPSGLDRWFTPETRLKRPDIIDRVTKTILADDPEVHAATWEMISGFEVLGRLGEIKCPTLILVGERDSSTPPAAAAALQQGIAGSRMVVVPAAAHMVTLESPDAINTELKRFFAAH